MRMEHVAGASLILLAEKKQGGFGVISYVSNSANLTELFGDVCVSWNLFWDPPYNLS